MLLIGVVCLILFLVLADWSDLIDVDTVMRNGWKTFHTRGNMYLH